MSHKGIPPWVPQKRDILNMHADQEKNTAFYLNGRNSISEEKHLISQKSTSVRSTECEKTETTIKSKNKLTGPIKVSDRYGIAGYYYIIDRKHNDGIETKLKKNNVENNSEVKLFGGNKVTADSENKKNHHPCHLA